MTEWQRKTWKKTSPIEAIFISQFYLLTDGQKKEKGRIKSGHFSIA